MFLLGLLLISWSFLLKVGGIFHIKKMEKVTGIKYWIVIFIALILLIINGYLVFNLLLGKIEFENNCPLPENISFCDCVYNALGDKNLRYCTCYPGLFQKRQIDIDKILNGTLINGTIRDNQSS